MDVGHGQLDWSLRNDPRVVVLSPGTHSETAYDQAFLANILGFPLVQGEDLVEKQNAESGLMPVLGIALPAWAVTTLLWRSGAMPGSARSP